MNHTTSTSSSPILSQRGTGSAWVLASCIELIADLSVHARGNFVTMRFQKVPDTLRVAFAEFAQRPREGLYHQIVPVRDEHAADGQGTFGIARAALRL